MSSAAGSVRTGAAGQLFTILDEQRQPVPQATLWMSGTLYTADDKGVVILPFSNNPQSLPVVLSAGDFSSLDRVQQQSETYELAAGLYIDREELLSLRKARVVVRPSLTIHGAAVSVKRLEDVRLVLTSTAFDGARVRFDVLDIFEGEVGDPPAAGSMTILGANDATIDVEADGDQVTMTVDLDGPDGPLEPQAPIPMSWDELFDQPTTPPVAFGAGAGSAMRLVVIPVAPPPQPAILRAFQASEGSAGGVVIGSGIRRLSGGGATITLQSAR